MMSKSESKTTLYTLRIWAVYLEETQVEWRGKLQALPDGEAHFFRGWPELINHLESMLGAARSPDDQSVIKRIGEEK